MRLAARLQRDGLHAVARAGRGDLGGALRARPPHPFQGALLGRARPAREAARAALDVGRFRAEREAIRAAIEARGYSERIGSYAHVFDGDELDAALLTLPLYGYAEAAHPRMAATDVYAHVTCEADRSAADRIAELLADSA